MSKVSTFEIYHEELFKSYQKLLLTSEEVAQIMGVSTKTLDRRRKAKINLPNFVCFDRKYYFTIEVVALYQAGLNK